MEAEWMLRSDGLDYIHRRGIRDLSSAEQLSCAVLSFLRCLTLIVPWHCSTFHRIALPNKAHCGSSLVHPTGISFALAIPCRRLLDVIRRRNCVQRKHVQGKHVHKPISAAFEANGVVR